MLGEWEGTVLDIMERRIENIKKKHRQQHRTYRKQVLREKRHLEYLEEYIICRLVTEPEGASQFSIPSAQREGY